MNNNLVRFRLDSIVGNVDDLEDVLNRFQKLLNLKPFIKFELVISKSKIIPIALITCGKYTIEILKNLDKKRSKGENYIESVVFESPYTDFGIFELSPNLKIEIRKNLEIKKAKILKIKLNTRNFEMDREFLVNRCGFTPNNHQNTLKFSDIKFKLNFADNDFLDNQILDFLEDRDHMFAGWHRFSLACKNVETATKYLLEGGAKLLEEPYNILPGLKESIVYMSSGLVIQPINQQLWKMIPVMMFKSLIAKFTPHIMQFKITEGKSK